MDICIGTVLRVTSDGLLIIEDDLNGNRYPATFDKIVGYRGESPTKLKKFSRKGLVPNIKVKFLLVPHEKCHGEKRIEQIMPAD